MKRKDDLTETIEDIGYGLKPDWDEKYVAPITLSRAPGPNNWAEVGPCDFGPQEDYFVIDHGEFSVFCPVSNAAIQWCYAKLPEDCPRYGLGFKIETKALPAILKSAERDRLMSEQEYADAMNENEQLMRSGE